MIMCAEIKRNKIGSSFLIQSWCGHVASRSQIYQLQHTRAMWSKLGHNSMSTEVLSSLTFTLIWMAAQWDGSHCKQLRFKEDTGYNVYYCVLPKWVFHYFFTVHLAIALLYFNGKLFLTTTHGFANVLWTFLQDITLKLKLADEYNTENIIQYKIEDIQN